MTHTIRLLFGAAAMLGSQFTLAATGRDSADPCAVRLASSNFKSTSLRALDIPIQLGFVKPEAFDRTLADTKQRFLDHLGHGAAAKDWTLSLGAIFPLNGSTSAAHFTFTDVNPVTTVTNPAEDSSIKSMRMVFDLHSGELLTAQIDDASGGPVALPGNVRMLSSAENVVVKEIDEATRKLVRAVQGFDYRVPGNEERANDHFRARVVRYYSGSNQSKIWIEVNVRALIEDAGGSLNARDWTLVFSINPSQHPHLRAADDPEVRRAAGLDAR